MNSLPSCPLSIQLLRLGRLAPTDSAHDELSRWNLPRLKSHPVSKFPATGPIVTGHSGEASTPTSVGPAKAPEDNCHTTAFQSMRGDNVWNTEPASAMTMRVTGAGSNLSPSGGGRGDSTLPYTVSFGPAIRI